MFFDLLYEAVDEFYTKFITFTIIAIAVITAPIWFVPYGIYYRRRRKRDEEEAQVLRVEYQEYLDKGR